MAITTTIINFKDYTASPRMNLSKNMYAGTHEKLPGAFTEAELSAANNSSSNNSKKGGGILLPQKLQKHLNEISTFAAGQR